MNKIISWIKSHKWQSIFILIALYVAYSLTRTFLGVNLMSLDVSPSVKTNGYAGVGSMGSLPGGVSDISNPSLPSYESSQSSNASPTNRMVVQNSNLSLVVKDVKTSGENVVAYANSLGGFMVTSSYSRPSESSTAQITILVPSDRFKEAVKYLESQSVKVTNENLLGTDITDQYVDTQTRLTTLETTKKQFEEIMKTTVNIDQILRIQKEIVNLQYQIDVLKGQQMALEKQAKLSRITVYLSSDEFSLPYTPDNKFRPEVTFKLALRSLIGNLTSFGKFLIWLLVYAVFWLPVLIIVLLMKRHRSHVKTSGS